MPVRVTPTVKLAAELLADNVKVLVPELLIGLNEAVTPDGKPGGVKPTLPGLKPPVGVIVIMAVPLDPGEIVRLVGNADRVKFGAGAVGAAVTVRLMAAVCDRLPEVPVSVTG